MHQQLTLFPDNQSSECPQCGAPLSTRVRSGPKAIYCSQKCGQKAWIRANAEHVKRYRREHHLANAERNRKQHRQWQESNKDHVRAYQQRRYDPVKMAEYNRQRRETRTPEERRAINVRHNQLRRARVADALTERIDWQMIVERDASRCYLCGVLLQDDEITLDHVIPLARGGSHTADNLRVACLPCNARKGAKLLSELS